VLEVLDWPEPDTAGGDGDGEGKWVIVSETGRRGGLRDCLDIWRSVSCGNASSSRTVDIHSPKAGQQDPFGRLLIATKRFFRDPGDELCADSLIVGVLRWEWSVHDRGRQWSCEEDVQSRYLSGFFGLRVGVSKDTNVVRDDAYSR
jgi:hypothetical protein